MKTIVIYNSQTGFTKRYAEWIAEKANAECMEYSKAKKTDLENYDAIIFGGWAMAGSITKIKWFKKNISKWKGKKLIAFCVGASPIDSPDVNDFLANSFTEDEFKSVKVFYCPGGLNYEKMSNSSKVMMKMFVKMLNSKKEKTEEDLKMIKMISGSYDISDIKYIEPILDCLKN